VRTILLFCFVVVSGLLLLGIVTWFVVRKWGEEVSGRYPTIRVDGRSDPLNNRMNTVNSFGAIRPIDQVAPGKEELIEDDYVPGSKDCRTGARGHGGDGDRTHIQGTEFRRGR
jgi:hypothetical protein